MCRFEMFYRGWADHLRRQAEAGHADIHHFCHLFDETAFIRFLFEVGSIGPILGSPCEPRREQDHNNIWLNEINDMYCWGAPARATVEAPVEVTYEPFVEASEEPLFEPREEPLVEAREEPESPPPTLSPKELREIRRVQRARHTRYAKAIEAWKKATGTPKLASKSEAFLLDPDPSLRRLEELLTEIHETEAADPAIRTAKLKSPHLTATALAIFLDRIIEKPITHQTLEQLTEVLRRSGHRIGEPDAFYTTWRPEELGPLTSRLDLPRLHKLLKETIHYRP
jgi:hypothetical protein